MRRAIALFFFMLMLLPAFAQEKSGKEENPLFQEASLLYRKEKYDEARIKFEEALRADPKDERIYLFLGTAYQELKRFPKAIEVLQKGLLISQNNKAEMLFNIGNCYNENGLGDYLEAEKYYSLAINENNLLPGPYLARAQIRMDMKRYNENKATIEDCQTYLRLYPKTPQKAQIEKLIAYLQGDIDAQAALLDSILKSLKNASTGTHTDAAGTTDFKDTKKDEGDILD